MLSNNKKGTQRYVSVCFIYAHKTTIYLQCEEKQGRRRFHLSLHLVRPLLSSSTFSPLKDAPRVAHYFLLLLSSQRDPVCVRVCVLLKGCVCVSTPLCLCSLAERKLRASQISTTIKQKTKQNNNNNLRMASLKSTRMFKKRKSWYSCQPAPVRLL